MLITGLGVQKKKGQVSESTKTLDQLFNKPRIEVKPKEKIDMRPLGQKLNDSEWRKKNSYNDDPTPDAKPGTRNQKPPPAPKQEVMVAGKLRPVKSTDGKPFSDAELREAQSLLLERDHPELYKTYQQLTEQIKDAGSKNDTNAKTKYVVQRNSLLSTGKASVPAKSDSVQTPNNLIQNTSDAIDRGVNGATTLASAGIAKTQNDADVLQTAVQTQINNSAYGPKSPLNNDSVKNTIRKGRDLAQMGETVFGAGMGSKMVMDLLGQDKNMLGGQVIDSTNRPLSTLLNSASNIFDKEKSPLEKGMDTAGIVASLLGVKDIGSPITSALKFGEGDIINPLINAGTKFNAAKTAERLATQEEKRLKGFTPQSAYSDHQVTGTPNLLDMANKSVPSTPTTTTVPQGAFPSSRNRTTPNIFNVDPSMSPLAQKAGDVSNIDPMFRQKPINVTHPDVTYPRWQQRTEGVIAAIDKQIAEGVGSNKKKGLLKLKSDLKKSIADQVPHQGIIDEYPKNPDPGMPDGTIQSTPPATTDFPSPKKNRFTPPSTESPTPTTFQTPKEVKIVEPPKNRFTPPTDAIDDGRVMVNTETGEVVKVPINGTTQNTTSTPKTSQGATSSNSGSRSTFIDELTNTSAREADLANDRELGFGMDALPDAETKGFQTSLDNARKKGLNEAKKVIATTEAILEKPRALNDEETAGFVDRLATIKREHRDLYESAKNIVDDPDEIDKIANQIANLENEFDTISSAVKKSGTEKGRALASQKLTLDSVNDIVSTKNSFKVAGREFYTKEVEDEAVRIGKGLEESYAKIKAIKAKESAFGKMVEDIKKDLPVTEVDKSTRSATRASRRETAVKNIQEKWKNYESETDNAPMMALPFAKVTADTLGKLAEIAPDIKELVKTYVEEGFDNIADIVAKINKDTGKNISEDDVNTILSNSYPKKTKLYSESQLTHEQNKITLAELRKQAGQSTPAQRVKLNKQIASLEKKIAEQKYAPKPKAEVSPELYKEQVKVQSLKIQHDDIVRKLREKKALADNPPLRTLENAFNVPKSLVLSLDNSAPLTHGMALVFTNPVIWAKATRESLKAFAKKEFRELALAQVRSGAYYDEAVAAKVAGLASRDLTEPQFSGILNRLPIVGRGFEASDRAFETFGAVARYSLFEKMAKAQESGWLTRFSGKKVGDFADLGEYINTLTGKGTGDLANALNQGFGKKIGGLFTAPGYTISRWKLALGSPLINAAIRGDKRLAAQIVKDYLQFAGASYSALKIAEKFGGEVDWDSKSTNYMKVKLPNSEVYIDPFSGIFAPYRVMAQLAPGSGKAIESTVGFYGSGKVSPLGASYFNIKAGVEGKERYGKSYDYNTKEGRINLMLQFLPLSIQNGKEIMQDKSMTSEQKLALMLTSFFGANVNVKEGLDKK